MMWLTKGKRVGGIVLELCEEIYTVTILEGIIIADHRMGNLLASLDCSGILLIFMIDGRQKQYGSLSALTCLGRRPVLAPFM
jgi:hypothetical protein